MATRKKPTGDNADHSTLSPFDGREVITASIAVTNAGDGLSTALGIEPREFHLGDVVDVLLRCEVTKIGHAEIKDTAKLNRVHTLRAGVGTIVEGDLYDGVIQLQKARNEEAKGILALDLDGDTVSED